jgi:small-conductance mechanosensitive channel
VSTGGSHRCTGSAVAAGLIALAVSAGAQTPTPPAGGPEALATTVAAAARTAAITDEPATLVYTNRPVVILRATVLGRPPSVRTSGAVEALDALVEQRPQDRVSTHAYDDAILVAIGDRPVFLVFAADVDPLAGETLAGNAAAASARLEQAFREAVELRTPGRLLTGIGFAAVATLGYVLLIVLLVKADGRLAAAAGRATERRLSAMTGGEIMMQIRAPMIVRRLLGMVGIVMGLLLTYAWLTAVLRRFPYTRPWGESLRGALINAVTTAGRSILDELPNLLTVLAIILITRVLSRIVSTTFAAVEQGQLTMPGVHPETTQPTRRIAVALLWVFALIIGYRYLPGSDSDVFKGVSVFVGLIISLGSSGVMNQMMSGLMVTYSRAVRLGDFVRIGDVEGTVTQLGTLSTKVRTPRNEDITIPNAVVASTATINYSRHADTDGVYVPTTVTIGYDAPWRQVQALLLLAAERTAGLRRQPTPVVLQTALSDFYVQYALLVCLETPSRRLSTLAGLHANIQDAFNEYGVQIMSPNYEADPSSPKVVPASRWYSAPAQPASVTADALPPTGVVTREGG